MKVLITSNVLDGVSVPFEVADQITVQAFGLEPGQRVAFYIVGLSETLRAACGPGCPPMVTLPSVIDEMQLMCCDDPILLTRSRPWVIIDSPQATKIRAKLEVLDGSEWVPAVPSPSTLVLWKPSNTRNVNDRMRGCACAGVSA